MPSRKRRGNVKPAGQIRQSQIVTTFGPGAMVDLPDHAVIIGGLDHWSGYKQRAIQEDRLAAKVKTLLGWPSVEFFAPPAETPAVLSPRTLAPFMLFSFDRPCWRRDIGASHSRLSQIHFAPP